MIYSDSIAETSRLIAAAGEKVILTCGLHPNEETDRLVVPYERSWQSRFGILSVRYPYCVTPNCIWERHLSLHGDVMPLDKDINSDEGRLEAAIAPEARLFIQFHGTPFEDWTIPYAKIDEGTKASIRQMLVFFPHDEAGNIRSEYEDLACRMADFSDIGIATSYDSSITLEYYYVGEAAQSYDRRILPYVALQEACYENGVEKVFFKDDPMTSEKSNILPSYLVMRKPACDDIDFFHLRLVKPLETLFEGISRMIYPT